MESLRFMSEVKFRPPSKMTLVRRLLRFLLFLHQL